MKIKFILLFIMGVLFAYQAEAKIKVPVGDIEVLEKVADLPDTEKYLLEEAEEDTRVVKVGGDKGTPAKYLDLGILYTEYVIAYVPLWTTKEPVLVLLNETEKDKYYELSDQEAEAILKENNLDKDKLLDTGFFTKFGGKLIALVVVLIIIYGFIPGSKKKKNVEPTNV